MGSFARDEELAVEASYLKRRDRAVRRAERALARKIALQLRARTCAVCCAGLSFQYAAHAIEVEYGGVKRLAKP